MAYSGDALARRFLSPSARELGVATLFDSASTYLDVKATPARASRMRHANECTTTASPRYSPSAR